jgi:hypothetical protein
MLLLANPPAHLKESESESDTESDTDTDTGTVPPKDVSPFS